MNLLKTISIPTVLYQLFCQTVLKGVVIVVVTLEVVVVIVGSVLEKGNVFNSNSW